jgi:hypothetical protein
MIILWLPSILLSIGLSVGLTVLLNMLLNRNKKSKHIEELNNAED